MILNQIISWIAAIYLSFSIATFIMAMVEYDPKFGRRPSLPKFAFAMLAAALWPLLLWQACRQKN